MSLTDNHINYVELKSTDLIATKAFYQKAFGWTFIDYGDQYAAITGAGLDGGFEYTTDQIINGALVVLYHSQLDAVFQSVTKAGGQISKEIFEFPGGKRFHFLDPSGNELAVWSDQ